MHVSKDFIEVSTLLKSCTILQDFKLKIADSWHGYENLINLKGKPLYVLQL